MKQLTLILFLCSFSCTIFAQVGIHNTNPKASLDITASNVATPSNTDGILIPRVDDFPASNPTLDQNGMLVFATGNGTPSKGFYYWDNGSTSWIAVRGAQKINDLLDGKSDFDGSNNGSSVFLGIAAGLNDDATDNQNVGVGYQSLRANTTGSGNTASGYRSLRFNTTGNYNIANGTQSLYSNTTGFSNTANGYQALYSNITGYYNTANGYQALYSNITGRWNTANGVQALYSNTTGYYNTANGYQALYRNTTGSYNIANGYQSLYRNTTGSSNIANGYQALYLNTTGRDNIANGVSSLRSNTTGYSNTANGVNSLRSNTTGNNNVAIGFNAGYNETGSNTLYIENSDADPDNSLIYGEFGTDNTTTGNILRINGELQLGTNVSNRYAMPTADGTANQILQTDGSGQISFVDPTTVGTDDQTIDTFSFDTGTNVLTLEVENDGVVAQTVDLSSLQDGTGNDWTTTGNAGTNPTTNFIGTTDTNDFVLKTNNVERARFLSNGNVGIGITAPNTRLTVKGIISASNDDVQTNKINIAHGGTNAYINVIGSGRLDFRHEGATGMSFTDQNRLGIATNAPTETLSVAGITNLNQGGTGIALKVDGTEALSFDGTQFSWGIGGSENYFEDNVGIGSSNPGYKLSVIDNQSASYVARFRNSSTNADADGIRISVATTSTTATNYFIGFYRGLGGANGRIEGNGTGVLYETTSDRRLKTNIKDITNSLAILDKIQPKLYEYKANLGTKEYGFIAQELQKVYPQAVSGDPNGDVKTDPMMVDYSRLTPILTAGIKELNSKVTKQQKEIESLKKENKELKQQLLIIKALEKRVLLLENKNDR